MGKKKSWSDEEKQFIADHYATTTVKKLAQKFGVTLYAMGWIIRQMGLRKIKTYGGEPYIKKRNGFDMWVVCINGKLEILIRIKWEEAYGPIPEGHILRCKDGNHLNIELDNWELISRAKNVKLNANHKKSGEGIKKLWDRVKLREAYGRPVTFCKYTTKKKKTHTPVNNHAPAKGVTF